MKKDIINLDNNGKYHGQQIYYFSNGNIGWIENWYHGKPNGYRAYFNLDNSINYKDYYNMGKWIYEEDHRWIKQIQIKI